MQIQIDHICRRLILLLVLTLTFSGSGCNPFKSSSSSTPPPGGKPPPGFGAEPVPVLTAQVEARDIPVRINAIGTVEASHIVAITSQIDGIITAVHVVDGQNVNVGDPLFTIDAEPFKLRVKVAEANLAHVHAEADKARLQVTRYEALVDKEYVSKDQYDQAVATLKIQEAAIRMVETTIEQAKLDLSYTVIAAPIAGRAGESLVKAGNLIRARDTSMPLIKINRLIPAQVRFAVPEHYLMEIRELHSQSALLVQARVKQTAQPEVSGTLSFIDNLVDRRTGMITLKADFPNTDKKLWPGQFVDVNLILYTKSQVLSIPSQAIETGQQGSYVWVVKADFSIENRLIKTGLATGTITEITQGLNLDETVVIEGQLRLGPHSKVGIKTAL